MKFTVVALIAVVCFAAVSATASGDFMVSSDEIEEYIAQDLAEEYVDIEASCATFIKRALRTLKGLNCTIKEVLAIQTAAHNFISGIHSCGGEVSKKVQNLINACNDIIQTCMQIFGINESVCGNTTDGEDNDIQTFGFVQGVKTTHKCFVSMLRKMQTLRKQIKYALKLIKQIKNVPSDVSACVMDAVTTLESYFTQFPTNIKVCSKLVS